jgi:peroxiredoxin
LVLGILAICLSFLLVGGLFGVIGLILGVVHLCRRRAFRGMAWWGSALSLLGLLAVAGFGFLYFRVYKEVRSAMESYGSPTTPAEWKGVKAPDFTVTTIDGETITLSKLQGKRVVVNLWATWCPPCRTEIPHFVRLANDTSREDLVIIGISSEDEPVLKSFAKKNRITYPIASAKQLPQPYDGIASIPTTFFIDSRGVIQDVVVGYCDFEALKTHALQTDFEGTPKAVPAAAASGLTAGSHTLNPVADWQVDIPDATALCVGDWDQDGNPEILIADKTKRLHILDATGLEKDNVVTLPDRFKLIEYGRHKDQGPRLLGYSNWGSKVFVTNREGKLIWSYASLFGVNGARWGDLDGDDTDELIVGMNGGGGLHAVGADGKLLWKVSDIGNVWNQAVIPARNGQAGMVFATEAGGSVKVYDAKGNLLRSLRPNGKYCTQVGAAVTDRIGSIQLIVMGEGATMGLDPTGILAWSTTAIAGPGGWRAVSFASGDLEGDGQREWTFLEASGDLVVANPQGEKICSIPNQKGLDSFAIVPTTQGKGILVTLKSGKLQAYRFE